MPSDNTLILRILVPAAIVTAHPAWVLQILALLAASSRVHSRISIAITSAMPTVPMAAMAATSMAPIFVLVVLLDVSCAHPRWV